MVVLKGRVSIGERARSQALKEVIKSVEITKAELDQWMICAVSRDVIKDLPPAIWKRALL